MPTAQRGTTTIEYQKYGSGFPIITVASGALNSTGDYWGKVNWDPRQFLSKDFQVITVDLRTAGDSKATITPQDNWDDFVADLIAVLDAEKIEKAHFVGMCIGGVLCLSAFAKHPDRFVAGVPLQPLGEGDNRDAFIQNGNYWAQDYVTKYPDARLEDLEGFVKNLFQGDFTFGCVTRDEVKSIQHPLFILEGNDLFHPSHISREVNELAPHSSIIGYDEWKTDENRESGKQKVLEFLKSHTK